MNNSCDSTERLSDAAAAADHDDDDDDDDSNDDDCDDDDQTGTAGVSQKGGEQSRWLRFRKSSIKMAIRRLVNNNNNNNSNM